MSRRNDTRSTNDFLSENSPEASSYDARFTDFDGVANDTIECDDTQSSPQPLEHSSTYNTEIGSSSPLSPKRRDEVVYLFVGRLEHISLNADFNRLFQSHYGVLKDFLEEVGAELCKCVEANPKRAQEDQLLRGFFGFINRHEQIEDVFFNDPINAWPMEVLFLVCHFYAKTESQGGYLTLQGKNGEEKVRRAYETVRSFSTRCGIITVGKGIFASLVFSMAERKEQLPRITAEMYMAAYDVGFVHRDVFRRLYPSAKSDFFAYFIVGISLPTINLLLEHVNKGTYFNDIFYEPYSTLETTIVYTIRSMIVTGHSIDLSRFNVVLRAFCMKKGIKVRLRPVPCSAPSNHEHMNRTVYHELLMRWSRMGFHLNQSQLKATVFSPVTGEEWNEHSHSSHFRSLHQELAFAATCSNHVPFYGLQHVEGLDMVIHIDGGYFGYGHLLRWECEKTFSEVERREGLFPPQHPNSWCSIGKTLEKMAVINNALNEAFPKTDKILYFESSLFYPFSEGYDGNDSLSHEVLSGYRQAGNTFVPRLDHSLEKFYYLLHQKIGVDRNVLRSIPSVLILLEVWELNDFLSEHV